MKYYECSNHLGNALTVLSDQKLGADNNTDGIAESYDATIVSASDYYPFGLEMPGRELDSDLYRYGFNACPKPRGAWGRKKILPLMMMIMM